MTERSRDLDSSSSARRASSRPKAGGRGRLARRPTLEALEGRSLLSVAGGPDFTYGPGGATATRPGLASINFSTAINNNGEAITGQALQADGKDVVIGLVQNSLIGQAPASTIYVGRLNADGSVDSTFGTTGSVSLPAAPGEGVPQAVAIQPDGKVVVVADLSPAASGAPAQVAVYRLNADGSADATFGTAGVVDFQFAPNGTPSATSTAASLAIDSSGDIVVGGDSGAGVAVARFTAAGAADATFGTSGQAFVSITGGATTLADKLGAVSLAVRAGGQVDFETTVVPASGTGTEIAVGQLTAAGAADATFGTSGQVVLSGSTADTAGGLAIQTDGKLVVAGAYYSPGSATVVSATHYDVYRLNTDGTVDSTFGTKGEATPVAQAGTTAAVVQDTVNSVLVQPDGKILVGGEFNEDNAFPYNLTVARLNADGSPDLTFGDGGRVSLPGTDGNPYYVPNNLFDTTYGLAIQPDGKVLVAADNGVARLLAVGAANDFNEDGISDPAVLLPNHQYPFFVYRPSGATAGTPDVSTAFGTGGAGQTLPAPGAYDNSGIDELGVYLPALGAFGIRPYGSTGVLDSLVSIGLKGLGNSIPAPADYTGAGHTEVGVFEPGTADFVYLPATSSLASAQVTVQFGTPGAGNSIPVPADYDGSGVDELAVYLPASASFAYRPAGGGPDVFAPFGTPGAGNSIPAPADYSGSGHTELAVYLPAIGAFAYRPYGTTGGKDVIAPFGMPGAGDSIPMPGDYDGSGHVELAVYMPTLDEFAYRPYGTDGSKDVIISFGQPGAGNTVPFNAQGAEYAANGGGGGGGLAHPSSAVVGWVDFVPDPAGTAKKGHGGSASGASQGQS